MNANDQVIGDLERRRKLLNEQLMNSTSIADANRIERELWALRAAIRHRKRTLGNQTSANQPSASPQPKARFDALPL